MQAHTHTPCLTACYSRAACLGWAPRYKLLGHVACIATCWNFASLPAGTLHRYLLELGVHMTLECCAGGDGASGLNNVWCIASKELERLLSGAAFIT